MNTGTLYTSAHIYHTYTHALYLHPPYITHTHTQSLFYNREQRGRVKGITSDTGLEKAEVGRPGEQASGGGTVGAEVLRKWGSRSKGQGSLCS